jgi:DNA polymerase III epsilon subunit-like protein
VIYIVTDIEADGGTPGVHSMIAFASVAVRETGEILGEFEAVLEPLPGATTDPRTMAWWAKSPEALAAARTNPKPPATAMQDFVDWVKQYPEPAFAAHPLMFDGTWMDYYLRRFTTYAVIQGIYETDRLFALTSLCLRSFGAAILGKTVAECEVGIYPPEWLGHHPHTHRAIDDARGYASLLQTLFRIARERA